MSAWVQTFLNSESVQTFLTQIKNVQTFSRGADIFYVKDGTLGDTIQRYVQYFVPVPYIREYRPVGESNPDLAYVRAMY